jgi:hypothetical protein
VLDGEVAIYDQQLRSRFDWLREPDSDAVASPPLFMAFYLLYIDRRDATGRPYRCTAMQQKELDGSRKHRWQRRILGEDTPDRQSGGGVVRLLALICAERTRQAGRFQSSSAPRVLLSPRA